MPDLEWKASAVADLMAIVDYISDDNPDAALALMDEIQGKVEQLPAHPKRCRLGRAEWPRGRLPVDVETIAPGKYMT